MTGHTIRVPLNYSIEPPDGQTIDVFFRVVNDVGRLTEKLPYLLYLQGTLTHLPYEWPSNAIPGSNVHMHTRRFLPHPSWSWSAVSPPPPGGNMYSTMFASIDDRKKVFGIQFFVDTENTA
jgi:hypothetical protein